MPSRSVNVLFFPCRLGERNNILNYAFASRLSSRLLLAVSFGSTKLYIDFCFCLPFRFVYCTCRVVRQREIIYEFALSPPVRRGRGKEERREDEEKQKKQKKETMEERRRRRRRRRRKGDKAKEQENQEKTENKEKEENE